MRRQRGFTLVELLVVFAIMALLVTVVPLAMGKLRESSQYRDTLRAMKSDLRVARQRAVLQGTEVRFGVDLGRRQFGIDGAPPRALPEGLQVRATVAGIELSPGQQVASIRFLPDGGATGGSIDVLRAESAQGTRLRVDWLSGLVTVEPIQP